AQLNKLENTSHKDSLSIAQKTYDDLSEQKKSTVALFAHAETKEEKNNKAAELSQLQQQSDSIRKKVKTWMQTEKIEGDTSDTNYIFLRFVVDNLPTGMVGLLIAIIFLASWGSIAAAINSLASSTMVDFHRRFSKKEVTGEDEYRMSKRYTLLWGIFCVIVAMYSYNLGNSLIETVNELGSIFYGPILGVFLLAFFFKRIVNGNVVFYSALLTEIAVLVIYVLSKMKLIGLGFLWLNPIGAFGVIIFSLLLNAIFAKKQNPVQ